jgi:hypothetical protein
MKTSEIVVGVFVKRRKPPDRIREVLHLTDGGDVVYRDEFGAGRCSLKHLASWADGAVDRPPDWPVTSETDLEWIRRDTIDPYVFSGARSELAKIIVRQALRDTELEDWHAGEYPPPGSIIVFPDGKRIRWEDAAHITDAQMRSYMIKAVNTAYTILSFPLESVAFSRRVGGDPEWNDAELDEKFMNALKSRREY